MAADCIASLLGLGGVCLVILLGWTAADLVWPPPPDERDDDEDEDDVRVLIADE